MKRQLPAVAASLVFLACCSLRRTLLPAVGGVVEGARAEVVARQPNHRAGKLQNDLPLNESLGAVAGAIFGARAEATRPAAPLHFTGDSLAGPPVPLAATWLGHSTVLLELDGARVLFDPVWSNHASPVDGLGPARYLVPPIPLDAVLDVQVVVISHDHYDHLDMPTIQALSARGVRFVVPVGIGAHLEAWGVPAAAITELGWWQETSVGAVRLVCTPSRHFSGRELSDRFATLWSGWAVVGPVHRAWFSGDSGFGPHFREIGKRLGPFDLTMPETGSYDPAWPDVHLGPEQALSAHRDVGGHWLLPVHWSAFVMGNHGWTEPGERLLAAAAPNDWLVLPRPGQRLVFREDADLPHARWWPASPWRTAQQAAIVSTLPTPGP